MRWLVPLLLLAGCAAAVTPAAPERPQRIVSLSPCADSTLRLVADPAQIAAISHWSHDPRATSVPLDWARRFPATRGTAEEVVAARPDLVVAGPHVDLPTLAALERMGVPLLRLPVPATVTEARAEVEMIARAVGHPQRGLALSATIARAVAGARREGRPVSALIRQGGGLVPGAGTLADELLRASGQANAARGFGLPAWGVVDLERLVAAPPELVHAGSDGRDRQLSHPVMSRLAAHVPIEPMPSRFLSCAGPGLIDTAAHLAAARDRATERPAR